MHWLDTVGRQATSKGSLLLTAEKNLDVKWIQRAAMEGKSRNARERAVGSRCLLKDGGGGD